MYSNDVSLFHITIVGGVSRVGLKNGKIDLCSNDIAFFRLLASRGSISGSDDNYSWCEIATWILLMLSLFLLLIVTFTLLHIIISHLLP